MKAAVVERYGPPDVIKIRDLPKPVPGEGEVLVKVRAVCVNSGDARVRALRVPRGMGLMMRLVLGWSGPKQKVLGFDAAGVVEAVGPGVSHVQPGDRVLASNGFRFGCHAEFVAIGADGVTVKIPDEMSFEDAVALPFGGVTSYIFFEIGRLKKGESILINGASGAVGVMAIQIAKLMGAEVTAVCGPTNVELVKELGADHVIDYRKQDFVKGATRYDVIMDNHGNAPLGRVKHLLKPGGRVLLVILDLWQMISARWQEQAVTANDDGQAVTAANYARLLDMASTGEIKPVIGKVFPFEEIAEAHRLVDTGHKVGSVVVTLPH